MDDLEHGRPHRADDVTDMGAWDFDPTTLAPSWDARCKAMFGLGPEVDPTYEAFLASIHEDDRARVERAIAMAVDPAGLHVCRVEFRAIGIGDKVERWLSARGRGLLGEGGPGARLVGTIVDISAERAEAALSALTRDVGVTLSRSESLETLLRECCALVVEHLGAAFARVWTLDASEQVLVLQASEGMYTHLDGAYARIPVGQITIGVIAKERRPYLSTDVTSDPLVGDPAWAAREGLVSFAGYPLVIGGRLVGVIAFFARRALSPVTLRGLAFTADQLALGIDRARAAEALQRSELRYRLATRATRDAVWDWDLTTGRVDWNEGARTLFGYATAEIGASADWWMVAIHPDDRDAVTQGIHRVIDEGLSIWQDEYRYRRRDGSYASVHDSGYVARDPEGRAVRMIGAMRDVTEERKSVARFRVITDAMPQLVWTTRADGYHEYYNQRWYDYTGLTPEETAGDGWAKAFHPDDLVVAEPRWRHSLATGEPYEVEYRCRRYDGEWRWFLGRALPVRGEDGRIVQWLGTCTDIHDQKHLELERLELLQRVDASRHYFTALVENLPELAWTAHPDGHIDYYNRRWFEYTGTTFEEMEGWGWKKVHDPEMIEEVTARWQHSIDTAEPFEMEFPLRGADGVFRWFLTRIRPLRDESGRIIRWFGTNTNIDEQRKAAAELRRLATVVEQSADFIGMMTLDGEVVYLNAAGKRMVGLEGAEAAAPASFLEYFSPEDRPFVEGTLLPTVRREGQWRGEFRLHSLHSLHATASGAAAGAALAVDCNVFLTYDVKTGEPAGMATVMRDIADKKLAEANNARLFAQAQRLILALEQSNKELDQFAYVASHDLKAPLRGIANLSEWLEEDLGDTLSASGREQMTLLRGRVHRLEALIDGILNYSRAGRVKSEPERVPVGKLVEDVVELLSPPPGVSVTIEPPMPVLVTEKVPLQQVFMNLIGNALKHAPSDDTRIDVAAREVGPHWEFSVRDNGPGIAPEYHERIWGIFQTLKARDTMESTGIGLSVVRKIVESKGGRAWVASAEGRGATFFFTWPRGA